MQYIILHTNTCTVHIIDYIWTWWTFSLWIPVIQWAPRCSTTRILASNWSSRSCQRRAASSASFRTAPFPTCRTRAFDDLKRPTQSLHFEVSKMGRWLWWGGGRGKCRWRKYMMSMIKHLGLGFSFWFKCTQDFCTSAERKRRGSKHNVTVTV